MTVTITIETDNAAFEDSGAGVEIARILRKLAKEYTGLQRADSLAGKRLLDVNGNTVGQVEVTGR